MFILIRQASDISTASSTSKPNAAMHVRSNENGLGVVAASVCCLALALGALLVV
jgi:hypothetical protein